MPLRQRLIPPCTELTFLTRIYAVRRLSRAHFSVSKPENGVNPHKQSGTLSEEEVAVTLVDETATNDGAYRIYLRQINH